MLTELKNLKHGALFYLPRDFKKYGEDESHLRVRGEYDRTDRKYYTERPYYDPIGNGRYMKGSTLVYCVENAKTIFAKYI